VPRDERSFYCAIADRVLNEKYSAKVTVQKRMPVRSSLQPGRIDLADIYITPISGQNDTKVHHHFALHDFSGNGMFIVRTKNGHDEHQISCTIWDLGQSFAAQVMLALKDLA